MSSVVKETFDVARKRLEARREELLPAVEEFQEIEKALSGLGAKRSRPRNGKDRSIEFRDLVAAKPGITVAEVAREMGIQPNYLYRVAKELTEEGAIEKSGSGYLPAKDKTPA